MPEAIRASAQSNNAAQEPVPSPVLGVLALVAVVLLCVGELGLGLFCVGVYVAEASCCGSLLPSV